MPRRRTLCPEWLTPLALAAFGALLCSACDVNAHGIATSTGGSTQSQPDAGTPDAGPSDAGATPRGDGGYQLIFGSQTLLPSAPSLLAVGDLNRDGKPDVVLLYGVPQSGEHQAQVFLGNGDGTLSPQTAFDTGQTPRGVALADFDGDGTLDAAIGVCADDGSQAAVLVFPGDGKGGFLAARSISVGLCPFALAVADVDGDGQPDLITAGPGPFVADDSQGEVRLFRGGGPQLSPYVTLPLGSAALGVAAADLSGGGRVDVAVSLANGGLQIFLGQAVAPGSAASAADFPSFPPLILPGGPYRVLHAADVNADGRPDLALSSVATGNAAVILNQTPPGGALQLAQAVIKRAGREPVAMAFADLGGAGQLDVLTSNAAAFFTGVSVLRVDAQGQLDESNLFTASGAYGLGTGDFNGDGRPDVVVSDLNSQALDVLQNLPPVAPLADAGPFVPAAHTPIPPVPNNGGPVLQNVELYTLTYADDPQRPADEAYASWIVDSAWFSQVLTEYGAGLGENHDVHLAGSAPLSLQDSDIQQFLGDLIADGGLPPPVVTDGGAPNQLYMIYYPAQTTISGQGLGTSCQSFGGYHSDTGVFSYAVIPTCGGSQSETQITVSHELAEAASDPFPISRPAFTSSSFGLTSGFVGEIGDLCTFFSVQEGPYVAQRIWSNAAAAAGGQPCIPAPDEPFVDAAPEGSSVLQIAAGQSVQLTLDAWSTAATQPFALGVQPFGVGLLQNTFTPTASLSQAFLANGQTATLTIGVPAGTPTQSYATVTVFSGLSDDDFAYWPILVQVQ